MDTIKTIESRRSIRKFQDRMIPRETIEELLELATKAPSGKNRQPWKFLVLQGEMKDELVKLMTGLAKISKEKGNNIGSFEISINAIKQAPVVILIFNRFSNSEEDYNYHRLLTDTQSIGAAIQTLILAAKDKGLGSLWICDVFQCDK